MKGGHWEALEGWMVVVVMRMSREERADVLEEHCVGIIS